MFPLRNNISVFWAISFVLHLRMFWALWVTLNNKVIKSDSFGLTCISTLTQSLEGFFSHAPAQLKSNLLKPPLRIKESNLLGQRVSIKEYYNYCRISSYKNWNRFYVCVWFFFQSTSILPIFYGRLVESNKSGINNYKTYITY